MTYAEKIKRLREVLLITQQELADLLCVSVVTVNRWENSKFNPTMKERRKLAKLFQENQVQSEDEKNWQNQILNQLRKIKSMSFILS
jgi:transcriptional regulator with XRE-family HTH domain